MSVLIEGIDMPKGYVLRIEIEPNGTVWEEGRDWIKHRQSAIQIDRPHGRLGDLDVLLEESLKEGAYNYVDSWQIAEQPTILEAEE